MQTQNRAVTAPGMCRGEKEATVICKGQQKEGRQIHEPGVESSNWEMAGREGNSRSGEPLAGGVEI